MNLPSATTSTHAHLARSGEIFLTDKEDASVRIFRDGDRFLLTADRRIGASHCALQVLVSEEQYDRLKRFSSTPGAQTAPREVERKWRVPGGDPREIFEHLHDRGTVSSTVEIEQGYLILGESEVRLRRKGSEFFLTLKGSGSLARCEVEVEISCPQFEALWIGTEGRRLEKTRTSFSLPQSNGEALVIEVDQFRGRHAPFAVVECEFPSEASAEDFKAPAWFGVDVTDDPAYKNKCLVRDGVPQVSLQELRAPIPR